MLLCSIPFCHVLLCVVVCWCGLFWVVVGCCWFLCVFVFVCCVLCVCVLCVVCCVLLCCCVVVLLCCCVVVWCVVCVVCCVLCIVYCVLCIVCCVLCVVCCVLCVVCCVLCVVCCVLCVVCCLLFVVCCLLFLLLLEVVVVVEGWEGRWYRLLFFRKRIKVECSKVAQSSAKQRKVKYSVLLSSLPFGAVLLSHPSLVWCCFTLLGGAAFSSLLLNGNVRHVQAPGLWWP